VNYFIKILDALSQLLNVILFNGEANHSISGDAYRFERKRLEWVINLIFTPFERDHCRVSHEADVRRAGQLLAEVRHK
jgi:hypothetical protein